MRDSKGRFVKGTIPNNVFKKGMTPWNKGLKGTQKPSSTSFKKGQKAWNKGIKWTDRLGEKHPRWIIDRNELKRGSRPYDTQYKYWASEIKKRDDWKCKIANENCKGRLEAHHILSWSKFPELRYQTNNGITLCHFHHPRKREDEIKLSPFFQSLVTPTETLSK